MKKILLILFLTSTISNSNAQIPGSPLKVAGINIKDNINNNFILKTINLNDYIECTYNNWGRYFGNQNFSSIVNWLHTSDDYTRIKRMGFNSVRVNICPAHIDSIPNLERIKEHIKWAKKDSLYVILAYFAPPGCTELNGYYEEKNFYTNETHKNKYKQQWSMIMRLCKDSNYSHVLYEFLNEPQIGYINDESLPTLSSYWKRNIYKNLMINLLDTMASIGDANRVVIIDGLSYANSDYRGFKYLKNTINRTNIVYSFHYYMNDFALRGCNWNLNNPYRNYTGYLENNNEWDTVSFNFNTGNLQGNIQPWIGLGSHDQKGTYKIKYLEIREIATNTVKLSFDLTNDTIKTDIYGRYILENGRRFSLGYAGDWGSAVNSSMYIHNNSSLAVTNTVKQDTGIDVGLANWAAISFTNESYNIPFTLSPSQTYKFKIVMNGDTIADNGGFVVEFKSNEFTALYRVEIQNLTYGISPNIEKILSSHPDRINASFITMNQIKNEFNVPIFLGEFGIPIQQREPNTYKYFRTIMDNVSRYNFSWAYFDYREPHENNVSLDSNYVTFGLFSGRDYSTPTATVLKIVNGINTGITSHILGPSPVYYYNKSLVDTLTRILGGSFVIPKQLNLTAFIQGLYNPNTNLMVTDTARAFLRNNTSPYALVDSSKGLLNNSGIGNFSFQNASNSVNYFVILKHRNSIETWSRLGQLFTSGLMNFNFSTFANQSFGNNQIQIDISPSRFGLYSGDVNQDGVIDGSDQSIVGNAAFNFSTGYLASDLNGDSIIDASDAVIADNNAYNFVSMIRP